MSGPSDLEALLRLRKLRESREEAALLTARQAAAAAASRRDRAERAVQTYAVLQRVKQQQAARRLNAPKLTAATLQRTTAELEALRAVAGGLAAGMSRARDEEHDAATRTQSAQRGAAAAQRKTEACEALLRRATAEAARAAERSGEIEAEDRIPARPLRAKS